MHNVMITGAGKIGSLMACMLVDSERYHVHIVDIGFNGTDIKRVLQALPQIKAVVLDVCDTKAMQDYIKQHQIIAVLSSLPYFLNVHVATVAKYAGAHYFDLTEDLSVTKAVKALACDAQTAFVPQCGLAPGFVSIVAHSLIQTFEQCHEVKLRVGALPQQTSNGLHYSLTWSTDGLINEYASPCHGIEDGHQIILHPLEGLESIQIAGCEYEAFNTAGGLGGLIDVAVGKIPRLNYKTIRYPGHCEKMRFMMQDLQLNQDRETLKRILEKAIPKIYQDVVIIYVSVIGIRDGELVEKSYVKKIYPECILDLEWSAIQVSTSSGICVVLDLLLSQDKAPRGFILQENFSLSDVLKNSFGRYFV